jgi:hypothetical protein
MRSKKAVHPIRFSLRVAMAWWPDGISTIPIKVI